MKVAIIGGGVFGAMIAIHLAERGWAATIFESLPALMSGASQHANRLHLGFHYPRHGETARQCLLGVDRFHAEFGSAVLPGEGNAYFIADEGSLTTPDRFLAFCNEQGLRYREIDPARFVLGVEKVGLGVLTDEVMYDPVILRDLIAARLDRLGVAVRLGTAIESLERDAHGDLGLRLAGGGGDRFDAVVNCSYANLSRVRGGLGLPAKSSLYEYIAAPVIAFDRMRLPSLTILDGPFFGLLPFNAAGETLLFHVDRSVVAHEVGDVVDAAWFDPSTAPLSRIDKSAWLDAVMTAASEYVPALRGARVTGVREGVRMVLADVEDTDARPSIVSLGGPGYVEVFSGKIVHAMWAGAEVERLLDGGGRLASPSRP